MKNLISLSRSSTTLQVLKRQLDRIELTTGYRPEDWLADEYEESYEEYMHDDGFDWDGFEMHMSCMADSFIDFIGQHYQHLNNNL